MRTGRICAKAAWPDQILVLSLRRRDKPRSRSASEVFEWQCLMLASLTVAKGSGDQNLHAERNADPCKVLGPMLPNQ